MTAMARPRCWSLLTLRREQRGIAQALLHQRQRRKPVVHMLKNRPAEVHEVHLPQTRHVFLPGLVCLTLRLDIRGSIDHCNVEKRCDLSMHTHAGGTSTRARLRSSMRLDTMA